MLVHTLILRGPAKVSAQVGPMTLTHNDGRSLWQVFGNKEEVETLAASLMQDHPQLQVEVLPIDPEPPLELTVEEENPVPIYEYKCPTCDKTFEVMASTSDPPPPCPTKNEDGTPCPGKPTKLVSRTTFILNGGGWASDSYS
jgi:putative FmdB family regulatory protein